LHGFTMKKPRRKCKPGVGLQFVLADRRFQIGLSRSEMRVSLAVSPAKPAASRRSAAPTARCALILKWQTARGDMEVSACACSSGPDNSSGTPEICESRHSQSLENFPGKATLIANSAVEH
jgi:hypothetical protein